MKTVLIVDDEFLVADVLAFGLEDAGFRVVCAENAARALELVERDPPSLVITDYMMPGMNGLDLAVAIRCALGEPGPPIILMSGAQAHLARGSGLLFASVFDKPFRMSEMVQRVQALLDAAE